MTSSRPEQIELYDVFLKLSKMIGHTFAIDTYLLSKEEHARLRDEHHPVRFGVNSDTKGEMVPFLHSIALTQPFSCCGC